MKKYLLTLVILAGCIGLASAARQRTAGCNNREMTEMCCCCCTDCKKCDKDCKKCDKGCKFHKDGKCCKDGKKCYKDCKKGKCPKKGKCRNGHRHHSR